MRQEPESGICVATDGSNAGYGSCEDRANRRMTENMTAQIRQLSAADFDEAMDMMNYSFSVNSPTDFPRLLPKLYRATDEQMSWHYAAILDGGIRAVVGLYPLEWYLDDSELRVAGIGGVSTHPRYRRRGLMQQLMGHCVEAARDQGYHVSWLGGQRQRYAYFGYERCGVAMRYRLTRKNCTHTSSTGADIRFEAIRKTQSDRLRRARELHDARAVRVRRPESEFYDHLISWNSHPYAALDADEMVGYVLARPGNELGELVASDDDTALQIVRAWVEQSDRGEAAVVLGPLDGRLVSLLGDISESVSIVHSGNWQVFDWERVVDALLKARLTRSFLADGKLALSIEGYGAIEIEVGDGEAHCRRITGPPALRCDALLAHRLLFGPLRPSQVMPLPPEAQPLEAWCPMPLCWPEQDHV